MKSCRKASECQRSSAAFVHLDKCYFYRVISTLTEPNHLEIHEKCATWIPISFTIYPKSKIPGQFNLILKKKSRIKKKITSYQCK